jgi:hypothetical protein
MNSIQPFGGVHKSTQKTLLPINNGIIANKDHRQTQLQLLCNNMLLPMSHMFWPQRAIIRLCVKA